MMLNSTETYYRPCMTLNILKVLYSIKVLLQIVYSTKIFAGLSSELKYFKHYI